MSAALFTLSCLAFAPPRAPTRLHAAIAQPRSSALIAPMSDLQLEDLTLRATLPQTAAPDAMLRMTVSACRVVAGAGAAGCVAAGAEHLLELAHSTRSLTTLHTVGIARAVEGLRTMQRKPAGGEVESEPGGTRLAALQHSAMLACHPLEFYRWWSRMLRAAPAAPAAVRRVASCLWLLWIVCTASLSVAKLMGGRQATQLERRTLRRRLLKLALDVPVATNYLLATPTLPLAVVGLLGMLSSWQMLRMALEDPSKPRTIRLPFVASLASAPGLASPGRLRARLSGAGRPVGKIPLCSSRDGLPIHGKLPQYTSQDFLPQIPLCSSRDGLPRIPLSSSRDGLNAPTARVPACSSREGLPRIPQCSSRERLAFAQ